MANTLSNQLKFNLINTYFTANSFQVVLMQEGFAFDPATHDEYSDILASELAQANGYVTGGQALTGVAITRNDTTNLVTVAWDNVTWVASGGSIVARAAVTYAVGTGHIVYAIDFEETKTALVDSPFFLSKLSVTV